MLRNAFENLAEDVTLRELIQLMVRASKLLDSLGVVDSAQRQRVVIDAISGSLTLGTITTVGTVTSVTNIAAIAGQGQQMYFDPARTAWNTGLRARITPN